MKRTIAVLFLGFAIASTRATAQQDDPLAFMKSPRGVFDSLLGVADDKGLDRAAWDKSVTLYGLERKGLGIYVVEDSTGRTTAQAMFPEGRSLVWVRHNPTDAVIPEALVVALVQKAERIDLTSGIGLALVMKAERASDCDGTTITTITVGMTQHRLAQTEVFTSCPNRTPR